MNQSVRNVIAKATARDLNGADAALSGSIVDGTNQLFSNEKYGLLCTKFLVQSVRLDDQMLKNEQAIAAAHRQQQLKLEQMESEHQNALRTLEMQAEKQKKESENALMAERGRQAILDEQCSAERRRKNSEYKELYTDQGFTVDHYLQLQYIKAQESLQSRAERVIYAPNDFFRGPTIK